MCSCLWVANSNNDDWPPCALESIYFGTLFYYLFPKHMPHECPRRHAQCPTPCTKLAYLVRVKSLPPLWKIPEEGIPLKLLGHSMCARTSIEVKGVVPAYTKAESDPTAFILPAKPLYFYRFCNSIKMPFPLLPSS